MSMRDAFSRFFPSKGKPTIPRSTHNVLPPSQLHLDERIQKSRKQVYLGNNRSLTSLFTGQKIIVDTRDIGIASHILWEGRWEPWIDHHVMAFLRPGMIVCDVGANLGYYTILAASIVGPTGRVFAYEPNQQLASTLMQSLSINGLLAWVDVQAIALGRSAGQGILNVDETSPGGASVTLSSSDDPNMSATITVRALDEVLPPETVIDFIKVDVEGAEEDVMAGASKTLSRSPLKGGLFEYKRSLDPNDPAPSYFGKLFAEGMTGLILEPDHVFQVDSISDLEKIPPGHLTNVFLTR